MPGSQLTGDSSGWIVALVGGMVLAYGFLQTQDVAPAEHTHTPDEVVPQCTTGSHCADNASCSGNVCVCNEFYSGDGVNFCSLDPRPVIVMNEDVQVQCVASPTPADEYTDDDVECFDRSGLPLMPLDVETADDVDVSMVGSFDLTYNCEKPSTQGGMPLMAVPALRTVEVVDTAAPDSFDVFDSGSMATLTEPASIGACGTDLDTLGEIVTALDATLDFYCTDQCDSNLQNSATMYNLADSGSPIAIVTDAALYFPVLGVAGAGMIPIEFSCTDASGNSATTTVLVSCT